MNKGSRLSLMQAGMTGVFPTFEKHAEPSLSPSPSTSSTPAPGGAQCLMSLFIYTAIPIVLTTLWLYTAHMTRASFPQLRNKRICLLIAHPDDEAMFFAPTLLALTDEEAGNHVKVLCLSNGISQIPPAVPPQTNTRQPPALPTPPQIKLQHPLFPIELHH